MSDIIEGKKKFCDLSLNTHHVGAELTNVQSENESMEKILGNTDSECSPGVEAHRCNANSSENHSSFFSVELELENVTENSTNGIENMHSEIVTKSETSLLDEITSSLKSVSFDK